MDSAASVTTVPGGENGRDAAGPHRIQVAGRDHAAEHQEDVGPSLHVERGPDRGHERQVACRQGRNPEHVDVFGDRAIRDLLRGGEERADPDVEAEVGEGRGDHLLAPVVPVLPDLRDQDGRLAAGILGEGGREPGHPQHGLAAWSRRTAIDARDHFARGGMAAEAAFERHRDLAHRRLGAGRLDRERQEVAAAGRPGVPEPSQGGAQGCGIALGPEPRELGDLRGQHHRIVDLQDIERDFITGPVTIHAHDRLQPGIDAGLGPGGGFLDPRLGQAGFDGGRHAA